MKTLLAASLLFILVSILGCSTSGSTPATQPDIGPSIAKESCSGTVCLGFWQVAVNKTTGEVSVVQAKGADSALNVLGFLEPPAMANLSIDFSSLVLNPPILEVDVILSHPIPDPVFTGFDVRGVVFGPDVVNADGRTPFMRPASFNYVAFGYKDGLLGVPYGTAHYGEEINGYKYFCDGLGAEDDLVEFFSNETNLAQRGHFSNGSSNRRHYILSWEGQTTPIDYMVFNYAVYANYDWPVGEPPIELDDFSISTANCREPFSCNIIEVENTLYYVEGIGGGGYITVDAEVWDWQGFDDYDVTISADPGLGPEPIHYDADAPGSTSKSHIFTFTKVSGYITAPGVVNVIVTAFDNSATFGDAWFLGLLPSSHPYYSKSVFGAWTHEVTISACPETQVTSINPEDCWAGQILTGVTINGSFFDGPQLAVKLTMEGQSDVIPTNIAFVDETTLTCDIDTTGMATGNWTVVVTNGCGNIGSLTDGFEAKSCESLTCPSASPTTMIGTNRLYNYNSEPTRAATTPRVICAYSSAYQISAIDLTGTTAYFVTSNTSNYSIGNIAVTSTDRIYYNDSGSSSNVYYMDYSQTTGFTNLRTPWGVPLPSGWYVYRMVVDADDNPVVLARGAMSSDARVYHWDGSGWGSGVNVPSTIMTEAGNALSSIWDFDYDPSTGYFFVVENYNYVGVHVFDVNGNVIWQDTNIWNISGNTYQSGVFIDKADPECRMILMAGVNTTNQNTYWARFNPVGGQKATGTTSGGTYGSTFSTFDGRGCVQVASGTARFLGATYGGNVWSSTVVPSW